MLLDMERLERCTGKPVASDRIVLLWQDDVGEPLRFREAAGADASHRFRDYKLTVADCSFEGIRSDFLKAVVKYDFLKVKTHEG